MGGVLVVVVLEVPSPYFATQGVSPRRDVDYFNGTQTDKSRRVASMIDSQPHNRNALRMKPTAVVIILDAR
jgi:hypothetical protein